MLGDHREVSWVSVAPAKSAIRFQCFGNQLPGSLTQQIGQWVIECLLWLYECIWVRITHGVFLLLVEIFGRKSINRIRLLHLFVIHQK